jgi:hypothetical protein
MARKRLPPDDPREWLNRAHSNLALARKIDADVYLEDLCFDAQRSAEKAIKAVFIHRAVAFPYIHNLADLLKRLERSGIRGPKGHAKQTASSRRVGSVGRWMPCQDRARKDTHRKPGCFEVTVQPWRTDQ